MATGWIRAYAEENQAVGTDIPYFRRAERGAFRSAFTTTMKAENHTNAADLRALPWGTEVALPEGLSKNTWTLIRFGNEDGFVRSEHLVEIAFVNKKDSGKNRYIAELIADDEDGTEIDVLWGDLVQIIERGRSESEVRVRGVHGKMRNSDLTDEALLEVYFIDVAQGDGTLVRTPDRRHLLIDGGLPRVSQQTGKNAADFLDWKFFFDYGDFSITLDSMMASHSDTDHFGGLHDLVRISEAADRELDCLSVSIDTFHHPGLSRWKKNADADPPHKDGLGPQKDGFFIQLLEDRASAEAAVDKDSEEQLSGPWGKFIEELLDNNAATKFRRLGVEKEQLTDGGSFPLLWEDEDQYSIKVLGPVTKQVDQQPALKDLGNKGQNTNGHSICLRIDYGSARILLTGDLNKKSMDWLLDCYGDRIGAWASDVAKACHHGSHDISYRFLEEIKAAVTVISSGDAEGHAHPRPEIVGASAITGFITVDRQEDKLITPLIYMTEVERSVSLGALNRIDIEGLPAGNSVLNGTVLTRHLDELKDKDLLSPRQRRELEKLETDSEIRRFLRNVGNEAREALGDLEELMEKNRIKVDFNVSVPQLPSGTRSEGRRAWRSRIMEKNHYGLVNMRTDGETIVCSTLNETEKKWIVHSFPARFGRG